MPNFALAAKRELMTQGWSLWINSATGQDPNVTRYADSVAITWKAGQAEKMEAYLAKAMKGSKHDPNDLNVGVDLGPVLLPLALKKSLGYIAAYTAFTILATKLIWKK